MAPVSFLAQATHAHTRLAARMVRDACETLGYGPTQTARVEIAVVEALNNVVEHAYASSAGDVDVEIAEVLPLTRCLQVTLRHGGTPMPASGHLPDVSAEDLEHIPESGFGLGLLYHIAEAVRYRPDGDRHELALLFAPGA
ncbi:MAG: ATP-binding protein [Bacteroidota bacterium]